MSEVDKIKEEIGYLKSIISILLTALFAVAGWFMLYDGSDEKSGMALAAIVLLLGLLIVFHFTIKKHIQSLRDL